MHRTILSKTVNGSICPILLREITAWIFWNPLLMGLSAITAIFHGIDEIFREATDEETNNFLASDFIVVGESYNSSCVKKPNRKRIALAKEALNSYDSEQKAAVLQSIRDYYPSIINNDDSFKIETDDDLTYLLYGVLQRYYTTVDGREKLIASSVRKL